MSSKELLKETMKELSEDQKMCINGGSQVYYNVVMNVVNNLVKRSCVGSAQAVFHNNPAKLSGNICSNR